MSSKKSSVESSCERSKSKKSHESADCSNGKTPKNGTTNRVGKHSLSQSLHNLFHRKKSYSLKHGSTNKEKKLYESINISQDSKSKTDAFSRGSDKARVWSVRNSASTSPVENCNFGAATTVVKEKVNELVDKTNDVQAQEKRLVKINTCSHSFDVLGSIKDYLNVNKQKQRNAANVNNEYLTDLPEAENGDLDDTVLESNLHDLLSPHDLSESDLDRSRLSSFGSSTCYSDTSFGCNMPFCHCYGNNKKSVCSTDSLNELNTSYWDLQLPSESPNTQDYLNTGIAGRRYSLSTSAECRKIYDSPDSRLYSLASRRLSDQATMHSHKKWQDKLLDAMNRKGSVPSTKSRSTSFDDFLSRREARACRSCRNFPAFESRRSESEIIRSSSLRSDIRKPLPIKKAKGNENKDNKEKKHSPRSHSADSSKRRRLYNCRQRCVSLRGDIDLDFSDIESSEESESTHEPKETSSEGQQQSSCYDFSSCSVSSGNEPNTPDIVKRNVLGSHIESFKTVSESNDKVSSGLMLKNEDIVDDTKMFVNIEVSVNQRSQADGKVHDKKDTEMISVELIIKEIIDSEVRKIVTDLLNTSCSETCLRGMTCVANDENEDQFSGISISSDQLSNTDTSNEVADIRSTETISIVLEDDRKIQELNEQHDCNVSELSQDRSTIDVSKQDEWEGINYDDTRDTSMENKRESTEAAMVNENFDENTKDFDDSSDIFGNLFHQNKDSDQSNIDVMVEFKVLEEHDAATVNNDIDQENNPMKNNPYFPDNVTRSELNQVDATDDDNDIDIGTDVDQGIHDVQLPEEEIVVTGQTNDASEDCEGVNKVETSKESKPDNSKGSVENSTPVDIENSRGNSAKMNAGEISCIGNNHCVNNDIFNHEGSVDKSANDIGSVNENLSEKFVQSKNDKESCDMKPLTVTDEKLKNEDDELEIKTVLTFFDAVLQNKNAIVESDHDKHATDNGFGESKMEADNALQADNHVNNDVLKTFVEKSIIELTDVTTETEVEKSNHLLTVQSLEKDGVEDVEPIVPIQDGTSTKKAFLTKAKSLDILNYASFEDICKTECMVNEPSQVVDDDIDCRSLKFHRASISGILSNSGDLVNAADSDKTEVDLAFEAISREANKEENKDKDMVVMFLVGGELKVIRRSGTHVIGNHGEFRQTDIPSMTKKDLSHHNGSGDYLHSRSAVNVNRGRPKSAIIVTRSQSFNGMANQHVGMGLRRDGPQAVVLGESFRHHRGPPMQSPRASPGTRGAVGFSFKKSPKVPKVPRPNRALLMFQSVKRGIREFIEATKEDIEQLQHREPDGTSTAQGKIHETDKQMKSAERYLKRLEFHLAKLDELHEYYLLQQQLREGVRTMHRAYITSPGNQRHTLSNVKYGYKECTQNMCNIEAQLEAMMGTFNCKLKGMAGFARLCPGDVFEVTVRHGTQKWKTKGRIEKTGNQKWDIPEFNFKAVVGDIFNIKGLEVRAFKSVLLGQKSCETKDLFSANPQLMTVSINVNGSLKLSIVITWNPLDGVDENFTFVEAPGRAQGTPRRRPVSVIALNGEYDETLDRRQSTPVVVQQTKDDNFILRTNPPISHSHMNNNNVTSYHGLDSPHVSARLSDHLPDAYKQTGPLMSQTSHHAQAGFHSSPVLPVSGESDSKVHSKHLPTNNNAFRNSMPPVMGNLHFPSVSPHAISSGKDDEHSVLNIEDILHNLSSSLEDYHGQYPELQKLEDLVKFAQKLIRKQFRSSSRSSSISVSIESALEAFDFLDTEDTLGEPQSPTDNTKPSFDDMLCSPESTAKTGDSGIESLAQRLSEDTQLGSSLGSSPIPPSTGNEEVDQCLMYHLTYCERLLENLGAFGPLKCREIYALDKLQKQCTIVENLLKLAKSGSQVDLHSVMTGICEDKTLREFWTKCTDQTSLYIHPERMISMLEQKYNPVIAEKHLIDPVKVCQHVVTRVLDIPDYEAEKDQSWFVLTLHQFMLYFSEEGGLRHVEDVAVEMKLVERLTSGNPDVVIKAILTLRESLPSSPCLKVIGMLLVTMDTEVEQCTISYLNLIQRKKESRDKAMVTFVEGLEDRTPEIRCGACVALSILEATESIDQLVYLWQSDSSSSVQKRAREALLALGDEGRKAFEEAQLSKHGFQGLQVHK